MSGMVNNHPPKLSLRAHLRRLLRRLRKPITTERRATVRVQLREAAHPGFDYYTLVVLSSVIATLGLLVNSPAIIIGAMLVAPLMSPIIGMGLSSITGDEHLLRDSAIALFVGAILAVIISTFVTLINVHLPFIVLRDLPNEVVTRTRPSPIDLGVALAGGSAAAFALAMPNISAALPGVAIATALMPPLSAIGVSLAMGHPESAGGATLLFITNAVTIAFAASAVFFILGFTGQNKNQTKRVPRNLFVSALLTIVLLGSLSFLSYRFVQSANENREIEEVVREEVGKIGRTELVEWKATHEGETLHLDLVIRTARPLFYKDSVELQKSIADRLQRPVSVLINQIIAAQLDPLIPPTYTPTPTITLTPTPGPSPTPTYTPTPRPTLTPTLTNTATPTFTPTNTSTATFTPTPALAQVYNTELPGLYMRQWPAGPVIARLRYRESLTLLYGYEIVDGIVWIEVMDKEGRVGWVPEVYLVTVTLTATSTPTSTSTLSPSSTATITPPSITNTPSPTP
jgi:uncharacterized hydrophobic protein (TIGR00271 family)